MRARSMARCMRWLLPVVAVAALAACEPSSKRMGTQTGPIAKVPPKVVVRDQHHHMTVMLRPNGTIADADWARIDGFLATAAAGRADTTRLTIAGAPPPAVIDQLVRHAFAIGYDENRIRITPPRRPGIHGRRNVELATEAFIPVLPNCPNTSHVNTIDGDNRVSSDWGCATISDLELQVADPHDLVEGESGGETDSVVTTAAIVRLQTDKLKKLNTQSTTSSSAAGGGQ